MMHAHVLHNGEVRPLARTRLSPGQAGLFSGWGVFSTMRLYGGRPFALDRHWRRLVRDARLMGMEPPVSVDEMRDGLARLARANAVEDGSARVYLVRNRLGWWHGDEALPETDVIVCTSDLPPTPDAAALSVRPHAIRTDHPLTGVKILSWAPNAWCRSEAQRRGFDDVVLLNERGEVAECSSANVFCVRAGVALTPPLASGCLDGITREVLLELARDAGLPLREGVLLPRDLAAADEAFISSTSRELLPVSRFEERQMPSAPGPVTALLLAAFRERVRRMLAADCAEGRA